MKIIMVDDEAEKEPSVRKWLGRMGYPDFKFITTPQAAIEGIRIDQPDVVILDINLETDINGLGVLRVVKPLCPNTKFMMLSGYTEYTDQAFAEGAHEYILKPWNRDELLGLIRKYDSHIPKESA